MAEDEALVAFYVEDVLAEHGATVVGPAETLAAALRLAAQEAEGLHAAVLDLNLAGHLSWPVAELRQGPSGETGADLDSGAGQNGQSSRNFSCMNSFWPGTLDQE